LGNCTNKIIKKSIKLFINYFQLRFVILKNFSLVSIIFTLIISACSQAPDVEANLNQAEAFLEKNLLNNDVIEVEPGLQYMVLESFEDSSLHPNLSDTITADFHGTLIDGSVFWSSIEIGEPLTIQLSQLIPGCQKLISLMQEGDFWRGFIHPDLAYGEEGRPTIPPNAALIFDIKLHAIMQNPNAK
jgi:FKBP-type peptidyl-prolyl cis-trans isomerase